MESDGDSDDERNHFLLADLKRVGFLFEPSDTPIAESSAVAMLGTHTHECAVCMQVQGEEAFKSQFCFSTYRVDGHQVKVGEPRHPVTICSSCVKEHVRHELTGGKLTVRCPVEGCGRALQTRELRDHTTGEEYDKL